VAKSVLLINGPNLNLLGSREPEIYGSETLGQIESDLAKFAAKLGVKLACFQSNHEGALIDRVQAAAGEGIDFLVVNAGALTHSSIGLRDAIAGVGLPFVEVHLSNIYRREDFRRVSMLADRAVGCIVGLGPLGYRLALEYAAAHGS
jgi:3-dehydroquinate dehydratase II